MVDYLGRNRLPKPFLILLSPGQSFAAGGDKNQILQYLVKTINVAPWINLFCIISLVVDFLNSSTCSSLELYGNTVEWTFENCISEKFQYVCSTLPWDLLVVVSTKQCFLAKNPFSKVNRPFATSVLCHFLVISYR